MSEEPDQLLDALQRALDVEGAEGSALRVHLAEALLSADRHADAFEACRVILTEEPGQLDALELAARASRALGETARAERYDAVAEALQEASRREAVPAGAVIPLHLVRDAEMERPALTLRDVAGMETVKRRLELAFLGPLRNPRLRALYGKSLRGGLLLWGPPGCGKTFLARAIAGELGAKFISVGLDDVLGMWAGQSETNLASIFADARRHAPCVLFIDEIDALGHKRSQLHGSGRNVVVQLLTELDGVDGGNDGVFVLGATNHPWDVDTALRRPGRLDRMLLVLPPDAPARAAILGVALAERPTQQLDLAPLVAGTEGYSGADLVHLCETATELALARSIEAGTAEPITQQDLLAALAEVRGTTEDWLAMARNYAELAGHSRREYADLLAYMRRRERR